MAKGHTSNYKYPYSSCTEIQKVSEYCKTNNINLIFLILPNYFETIEFIRASGLEVYYNQFKNRDIF